MARLTPKQRLFCKEYIIDLNATGAAERTGYSPKTAYSQGQRLLKNVEIQKEIQSLKNTRSERTEITADRVLLELSRIGFFDPRKLFNADGSPKQITELDDDTAACIAGLEVIENYEGFGEDRKFIGYTKKYKITDKKGALDSLGKHLGLFIEKIEHTGKDGGPIKVRFVDPKRE